jgi:hypothetical protein
MAFQPPQIRPSAAESALMIPGPAPSLLTMPAVIIASVMAAIDEVATAA